MPPETDAEKVVAEFAEQFSVDVRRSPTTSAPR